MYKYLKRITDFVIALVALVVLFVPLLVVAILIKLDSKGPVIFKQERLGKNGVPFKIWEIPLDVRGSRKAGYGCLFLQGRQPHYKSGQDNPCHEY